MKRFFLKVGLALCSLMVAASAVANVNNVNSDFANVCTIVKNNDKAELRKKLSKLKREYKLRLNDYYTGITCGGKTLIRYSMVNGATDAGQYLIKQMRKSELNKAEADGKTIKQWAEENGHIGTPIGAALLDRLG